MSKVYKPKVISCSICGTSISDKFSNNAEPVNKGRCCADCNATVVIPRRIAGARAVKELN